MFEEKTMVVGDFSSSSPELHVIAVDDNFVDRKVIERLLRISACKVTTVESGTRALTLQYLGLDGDKGSSSLKDLKVNLIDSHRLLNAGTNRICTSQEDQKGAEDFLLKPVKLADVKRLKELIMRSGEAEERKIKNPSPTRILQNDIDSSPSSTSSSSSHDVSSLDEDTPSSKRKKLEFRVED